jgi:hypothetical protein
MSNRALDQRSPIAMGEDMTQEIERSFELAAELGTCRELHEVARRGQRLDAPGTDRNRLAWAPGPGALLGSGALLGPDAS